MGGSDFYCSVTATRFMYSRDEVRQAILQSLEDGDLEDGEVDEDAVRAGISGISRGVLEGLLYSQEDVDASNDYVLICPYTISKFGSIAPQAEYNDPRPDVPSEANITEVFNVVPGDNPELGCYKSKVGRAEYCAHSFGPTCIVTYSAYMILKQAAPNVKPHTLYALFAEDEGSSGALPGVNYAPVEETIEQYVCWSFVCDYPPGGDYTKLPALWLNLMTQKDKSTEEKLRSLWGRPGNLWAYVRPDRFPIKETLQLYRYSVFAVPGGDEAETDRLAHLAVLPTDLVLHICEFLPIKSVLAMAGLQRTFRSRILPSCHMMAYRRLLDEEPWLLPTGPFELNVRKRGTEEIDFWKSEWAKCGISGEYQDRPGEIPWLLYLKACSECYSMWNRKRIWGIARQIEKRAIEKGLIQ